MSTMRSGCRLSHPPPPITLAGRAGTDRHHGWPSSIRQAFAHHQRQQGLESLEAEETAPTSIFSAPSCPAARVSGSSGEIFLCCSPDRRAMNQRSLLRLLCGLAMLLVARRIGFASHLASRSWNWAITRYGRDEGWWYGDRALITARRRDVATDVLDVPFGSWGECLHLAPPLWSHPIHQVSLPAEGE